MIPLLVYWGSLDNPFQYDDIHSIVENPHIRSLGNISRFFVDPEMFSADPQSAMYRPFVLASYAVNYAIGEYEVASYHAFNLLLHCGNVLLVFLLLRAFGVGMGGSFLGGLLFALHPVNSEVVNYISSRSESLCAFLFLSGFLCYRKGTKGERESLPLLVVGLVCFIGAIFSKAVGITLIGVLLWYELLQLGNDRSFIRIVKRQWPFWLVGAVYLYYTRHLVSTALLDEPVRGTAVQLATQFKALVYYLQLLLFPVGLNVEHQFILADGLSQGLVLICILLIGSVLFWLTRDDTDNGRFWIGWTGIVLAPTLLIPLNVLVNEHRLYLPMVALAGLTGAGFERLAGGKSVKIVVVTAVILSPLLGVFSWQRSRVWASTEDLWHDSLDKAPLMPRPHIYAGDIHRENGRFAEALKEYGTALSIYPQLLSGGDALITYNNIGSTYLAMGRFAEATQAYQKALQIDSTYAKARVSLEGLLALQTEQEKDPMAEKLRKQGLNLMIANRFEEAEVRLKASLNLQNDPQTWLGLGLVYERKGDSSAAIGVYETLRIVGSGSGYAETAEKKIRTLRGER